MLCVAKALVLRLGHTQGHSFSLTIRTLTVTFKKWHKCLMQPYIIETARAPVLMTV